jgi:hypothetical protein
MWVNEEGSLLSIKWCMCGVTFRAWCEWLSEWPIDCEAEWVWSCECVSDCVSVKLRECEAEGWGEWWTRHRVQWHFNLCFLCCCMCDYSLVGVASMPESGDFSCPPLRRLRIKLRNATQERINGSVRHVRLVIPYEAVSASVTAWVWRWENVKVRDGGSDDE